MCLTVDEGVDCRKTLSLDVVGDLESDEAAGSRGLRPGNLRAEPGRVVAEGLAHSAFRCRTRVQSGVVVGIVEATSTLAVEGNEEGMEGICRGQVAPAGIDPGHAA